MLHPKEHIYYWTNLADSDFEAMNIMFANKQYHWALFMGHLVIEKLLKAILTQNSDSPIPRVHDLSRLAELANVPLDDITKEKLDLITTFNISARYPDYKNRFYQNCTAEYTEQQVISIKELRSWLLTLIITN